MADRIIRRVWRDQRGRTRVLAGVDWQRDARWAIQDILADRHAYFTLGTGDVQRPVFIVHGPSGPYLRTSPDSLEGNNLDTMDAFDVDPWEVALDDTGVLAVHAALVPHGAQGQVLMFGGNEHDRANADAGDVFHTRLYDVADNRMIDVDSPPADVFCCGHAFLGSGRPLVGGGTASWRGPHVDAHAHPREHWDGARETARYELDGTWTATADLQFEPGREDLEVGGGRWYPTLLTLADGRILAIGGHPDIGDGRHGAWLPEAYDPATDRWTYQPGHWMYVNWPDVDEAVELPPGQVRPGSLASPNYLYYQRLFVLPGGAVFMATPNDGHCGWYDVESGEVVGHRIDPPFAGSYRETNHTAVLLPLLPGDGYRAHVLLMGNGGSFRISLDAPDSEEAPQWLPSERGWTPSPPLRHHGTATLLPTGQVLFSGGIDEDGEAGLLDANAALTAELYTPGIDWAADRIDFDGEHWAPTTAAQVPRNYHSVALLLPNGRVLTAGSNLGGQSGGDDVKEYRVEIYTPDWFHDVNRPRILQAPGTLGYGQVFQIACTRSALIERAALMRCGTVTHAWDGDQRYVGLAFSRQDTGLTLTAPPDGSVAPPGAYMLWIVDGGGRPCALAPFIVLN